MNRSIKKLPSQEIPNIIEKAAHFGGRVTQINPSKTIESLIRQIEIDIYGTMTITLFDELPLERNRPINITFNYRNLSFYLSPQQYAMKGDVLIADSPVGAKALAIRDHERYIMPLNQKITSSIYRVERRGSHCNLEGQIVDISLKGFGILISKAEDDSLLQHDHVWIKEINGHKLPQAIFGKVVYVSSRKFKDGIKDLKVGISLETKLSDALFEELKSLSSLVLKA